MLALSYYPNSHAPRHHSRCGWNRSSGRPDLTPGMGPLHTVCMDGGSTTQGPCLAGALTVVCMCGREARVVPERTHTCIRSSNREALLGVRSSTSKRLPCALGRPAPPPRGRPIPQSRNEHGELPLTLAALTAAASTPAGARHDSKTSDERPAAHLHWQHGWARAAGRVAHLCSQHFVRSGEAQPRAVARSHRSRHRRGCLQRKRRSASPRRRPAAQTSHL